ncbi:MAG: fumarate hydratase [Coriobacteriia bacterium]|nr:fumarate hydratase [Coriobacteriia bacterium]
MVAESASILRPDILEALHRSLQNERNARGRHIIEQLIKNAEIAERDDVPICQDTGTVWVRIELGEDTEISGSLVAEIHSSVERAYREKGLRMSVVEDALIARVNTNTNTPAFIEIIPVAHPGIVVSVMLKGAGSDNASRLEMLNPNQTMEDIKALLVELVHKKASMACPPLIIGIGVGSTFDKVGGLAKKALLRAVGSRHENTTVASFEDDLLQEVNRTGIGPGGLGGDTTALAIHIQTAPCHIAALPVAVNMGCSAMRSRTRRLL